MEILRWEILAIISIRKYSKIFHLEFESWSEFSINFGVQGSDSAKYPKSNFGIWRFRNHFIESPKVPGIFY